MRDPVISPCKGCPDRSAECHGKCEKYAAWNDRHVEWNKEHWDRKHPEFYDYVVDKRYRGRNSNQR